MKIYYVLSELPSVIGYTDNEFIWKKYIKQFPKDFKITYDEMNVRTEDEFLSTINKFLFNNVSSFISLTNVEKLFTIEDKFSNDIIVINRVLYNDFIESFVSTRELNKILNEFYRHFGYHGKEVNKYILGSYGEMIDKISSIVYNKYYSEIRKYRDLDSYEIQSALSFRLSCELWEIVSEYYELKRYFYIKTLLYNMKDRWLLSNYTPNKSYDEFQNINGMGIIK